MDQPLVHLIRYPIKFSRNAPSVIDALLNIFNQSSIPSSWKVGVTRLLGKPAAKDDSKNPGKVFTSILKQRLMSYMIFNNYLDTSIQKAFVNKLPSCLEHQVKLFWIIQKARSQQRNLAICWIDLANAFGSVDHQLISFALDYRLPQVFVDLVKNFYTNLLVIVSCNNWSNNRIPIDMGIFQGDPLSM